MQKHGRNLSIVFFCLFLLPVTQAQNDAPIHAADGEYIKEWLVLGPFFPDNLEKDFLIDAGGEACMLQDKFTIRCPKFGTN